MSADSIETLKQKVVEQNQNRPGWENDNAMRIVTLLLDEANELLDAIQESMITGDPWPVASEMADVFDFLLLLSEQTGIELGPALEMKLMRNSIKYPDYVVNGDGAKPCKELWSGFGGDITFSKVYLDFLAGD